MNKAVWLGSLLTFGGVLEIVVGVGLLFAPAALASILLQSTLDQPAAVISRIAGAALVSLGIACWSARKTPLAPASIGVSWGYLVYNVVACVTLAWTALSLFSGGLPALGASVVHGVLAIALLGALLNRSASVP